MIGSGGEKERIIQIISGRFNWATWIMEFKQGCTQRDFGEGVVRKGPPLTNFFLQ